ncbi:hypothetical protein BDD43_4337 [Mucilaginibacter gracilis]|uniref:Uncharacterized protein n=1 Tax=Mucilaginibacter gracilis TaxID=423350 RepID=A0A495J554_9SPHI|nr:DUF6088 family protein [Mucilaginibacter gracilis]RKR84110.1 hypothetical protein BDD43_4337 [Mucilaginibacter gracilis]
MNSTHQLIANKISRLAAGELAFPTDFRGMGSEDAIKMSLSRHTKENRLERLGHGVYLKAGKTAKIPAPETVAMAIARKDRVRIRPDGQLALFQLGLIESRPDELIYLTDGEPRSIKIGEQRLIFKSTTAKKLSLSDTTSGLLVLALDELGKDKVTDKLLAQITDKLSAIDKNKWTKDLQLASGWIYNLLHKLYQQTAK